MTLKFCNTSFILSICDDSDDLFVDLVVELPTLRENCL